MQKDIGSLIELDWSEECLLPNENKIDEILEQTEKTSEKFRYQTEKSQICFHLKYTLKRMTRKIDEDSNYFGIIGIHF